VIPAQIAALTGVWWAIRIGADHGRKPHQWPFLRRRGLL
jgi:hypothetical protein